MIKPIYTYAEYRTSKINNSFITRFENLATHLQKLFGMPVAIIGMHNSFKNKVSGQERKLADVTPRLIMDYGGISIDRGAMSGIQASVSMTSTNQDGNVGDNIIKYRRLPAEASFSCQIVVDEPVEGIRLTEYICILALEIPQTVGDEYTISTLIFNDNANIKNEFESSNNYVIDFNIKVNMQIPEPMTLSVTDSQNVLAGVGVQRPDGTWDETPLGEIAYLKDDEGNFVLGTKYKINEETGQFELGEDGNRIPELNSDGTVKIDNVPMESEDGEILYGNFVSDGSYRLHPRVHVHPHRIMEECLDNASDPMSWERKAIAEYYPERKPGEYINK